MIPSALADEAHLAAIAEAKRQWLVACEDGSSPADVQRLYEAYRRLVIAQVAAVATDESARTA